jgi:hypothetical protein
VTDLPDIKLKALVSFPANVVGGIAIDVTQKNGAYTFDLDINELAPVTTVPAASYPTTYLVLWNSATGTFNRISITNFKALP